MKYLGKVSLTMAALALSAVAFAGPDLDTRVQDLEKQMKQVRTETAKGTYGATTALARPEVQGNGYFLTLDILYWHAKVGGTEYSYTDNDLSFTLPVIGRTRDLGFGWDWGVRFGAGYNFEYGGWDTYVNFTLFDTNDGQKTTAGLNGTVIPLRGTSYIVDGDFSSHSFTHCNEATSQFDLDFERIDVELGRNYFISKELALRPHFGLVTAWINEDQVTRYTGGSVLGINTVNVKDRNDFWGIGIRTGLNTKWFIGNGFSIFGNASGALVYGYYEVQHKEWYTPSPTNYLRLNANMHRFSPTAQLTLGLSYEQYLNNDKQHISLSLGYDVQYWWRQNQMLQINDNFGIRYGRYSEDLGFYGITLDIRWDF